MTESWKELREAAAKYRELERWKDKREGYDEGFVAGWRAGLTAFHPFMRAVLGAELREEDVPKDGMEAYRVFICRVGDGMKLLRQTTPQLESLFDTEAPAWYQETDSQVEGDQPHVIIPPASEEIPENTSGTP